MRPAEKARYRLNKKVAEGILHRRDGTRGGPGGSAPAAWFLADLLSLAGQETNQKTGGGEQTEKQSETKQASPADQQTENWSPSGFLFGRRERTPDGDPAPTERLPAGPEET